MVRVCAVPGAPGTTYTPLESFGAKMNDNAVESTLVPFVFAAVAVIEFAPGVSIPAGSVAVKMPEPVAVSVAVATTVLPILNFTVEPVGAVTVNFGVSVVM